MNDRADDDHEDDDLRVEPAAPTEAGGLIGQLVAARTAAADDQSEEWEVPNNGGLLWLTTRLLPWKRMKQFAEAAERSKNPTKELKVAGEMIAEATTELWLRDPDGQRQPWPGGEEGLPFGPELLKYLQVPPLPAGAKSSDYVRVVMAPVPEKGGEVRESAVTGFFQRMMEWTEESHERVTRDFAEG